MKGKENKDDSGWVVPVIALVSLGSIAVMICKMLVKIWEGMWH